MQSPDPRLAVAEREIEAIRNARFLGAELWSGAGPPDAGELQRLVADGLEKGFLTYDEIAAALEDVELTREQTEDFYTYVVERSIELVEGEQHKQPVGFVNSVMRISREIVNPPSHPLRPRLHSGGQ
jgi:Sigma-70 factor, region 1.1